MDQRTNVLVIARGRIVMGLAMLLVPSIMLRVMFGRDASTRTARVMARMFGAREVVLGVGTITSVKERTQDAEWVSASAVVDALPAAVPLGSFVVPLDGPGGERAVLRRVLCRYRPSGEIGWSTVVEPE